jgi:hypothetical protein
MGMSLALPATYLVLHPTMLASITNSMPFGLRAEQHEQRIIKMRTCHCTRLPLATSYLHSTSLYFTQPGETFAPAHLGT